MSCTCWPLLRQITVVPTLTVIDDGSKKCSPSWTTTVLSSDELVAAGVAVTGAVLTPGVGWVGRAVLAAGAVDAHAEATRPATTIARNLISFPASRRHRRSTSPNRPWSKARRDPPCTCCL